MTAHAFGKRSALGRRYLARELLINLVADDDLDDLARCVRLELVEPAGELLKCRPGRDVVDCLVKGGAASGKGLRRVLSRKYTDQG